MVARFLRVVGISSAVLGAGAVGTWCALLPRVLTWGATADEAVRSLPGDALVGNPIYVTTRATTVTAPASAVWPWLVQIGQNRGGFYTYDALENLLGLDMRSADRVHAEWQDPRVGDDFITLDPDGVMTMTVAVLEPERAFVVQAGRPGDPPQGPGSFFKGEICWTWGFYLEPLAGSATRLVVRVRAAWADTPAAKLAKPLLLEPAHFLMEERMLRGIRDRAERAGGG